MEGDPTQTTVDLRCARRCSARAGTGAEISKSYVKELLTHYTSPKISAVFFADARAAIFVPRGRGATTNSFV